MRHPIANIVTNFTAAAATISLSMTQHRVRSGRLMVLLGAFLVSLYHVEMVRGAYIPFGYQSDSSRSGNDPLDPSSFVGSVHYDMLHHALYITGATFAANVFDGRDPFDLKNEQKGWDLGVPDYSPNDNGDCFYAVMALPMEKVEESTQLSLLHSRRFGSQSALEACSAGDILHANADFDAAGAYSHAFEEIPAFSPQPSSSTYNPTYSPSITASPAGPKVPVELNDSTDPSDTSPTNLSQGDFTDSNIARIVRIDLSGKQGSGPISFVSVEVYDTFNLNQAYNKSAMQSSNYDGSQYLAYHAIDGDPNTFSLTQLEDYSAWWQVDMEDVVTITSIKLVSPECGVEGIADTGNCDEQLLNATLSLINEENTVVATRKIGETTGKEYFFSFVDAPTASTVSPNPVTASIISSNPTSLVSQEGDSGVTVFPVPTTSPRPSSPYSSLTFSPSITVPVISATETDVNDSNIARVVKIQLPGTGDMSGATAINIVELLVYDSSNTDHALNKDATQSSIFQDSDYFASNAVDGDFETFSHTDFTDISAWWQVDMGEDIEIATIRVVNRACNINDVEDGGNCEERLSNSTLLLIDSAENIVATRNFGNTTGKKEIRFTFLEEPIEPTISPYPSVFTYNPTLSPNAVTSLEDDINAENSTVPTMSPRPSSSNISPTYLPTISAKPSVGANDVIEGDIDNSAFARIVKIERSDPLGELPNTAINILEVQVYDASGTNQAQNKTATQASNYDDSNFLASNAVDGDLDTFSHTDFTDSPWWQVDMGEDIQIKNIRIVNRPCTDDLAEDDGNCEGRLSNSTLSLINSDGTIVATRSFGDTTGKKEIRFTFSDVSEPTFSPYPSSNTYNPSNAPVSSANPPIDDSSILPLKRFLSKQTNSMEDTNSFRDLSRLLPPIIRQDTRSVRFVMAGHVETTKKDDGYIVSDMSAGHYDEEDLYAFAQLVDIRLPLGEVDKFVTDIKVLQTMNASLNKVSYNLEKESIDSLVFSGIDSKALLNDHLPSMKTLYPVSLVTDLNSKKDFYVMMLVSINAAVNNEGKDVSLHQDPTIGSGANQQSWTDFPYFGPSTVHLDDYFGINGRPKYGSQYRIILKKMSIDSVNDQCVSSGSNIDGCDDFSEAEKNLSATSYNGNRIIISQTWVEEYTPEFEEDTRPSGLVFAHSSDIGSPDLLLMVGSTSGKGFAFGTNNENVFNEGDAPEQSDLDGFVTKIRADTGAFFGASNFSPDLNSFTNTHSTRIQSQPDKNDIAASVCVRPQRFVGSKMPIDHIFVVGSTEGLLPGIIDGVRDETYLSTYPEKNGTNSMEAFLMKIDLTTMNILWTVQVGAIDILARSRGDSFGFGCAVTHDGEHVYLSGMVKEGGIVTNFPFPGSSEETKTNYGGTDVFVASYSTLNGDLVFLKQFGSTKNDSPSRGNGGITTDRSGNAIISGNTRGSLMRARDVSEYVYGIGGSTGASDIFVMSLERDTGNHAPISEDGVSPVITIDNNGIQQDNSSITSASQEETKVQSNKSAASSFLIILLVLLVTCTAFGIGFFALKARKRKQLQSLESHLTSNHINLNRHRTSMWKNPKNGDDSTNLSNSKNIKDLNHEDNYNQIDFGTVQGGGKDSVIEQSLFMDDGLQGLDEIEKNIHHDYSIGEMEDDKTDEDLIQAYNEAMAVDIEPESEAVAKLGLTIPSYGSELT